MVRCSAQVLALAAVVMTSCGDALADPSGTSTGSTSSSGADATLPTTTGTETAIMTVTGELGSESTDAGATGSTTADPNECGDGILGGDEQCDSGKTYNHDGAYCKADCTVASCGDGDLFVGREECDEGEANTADPPYGSGCTLRCTRGARCGDGVLQDEYEQCEDQPLGGVPCVQCRYHRRVVFITSETYNGALGKVAGARDRCNDLALVSGLSGYFRPWLLASGQDLKTTFPEYADDPEQLVYFTTLDNLVLAEKFQELIDHGPRVPISMTEKGTLLYERSVWTNITVDGYAGIDDCGDWDDAGDAAGNGGVGHNGYQEATKQGDWLKDRLWTAWGAQQCADDWFHLYCIQVTD